MAIGHFISLSSPATGGLGVRTLVEAVFVAPAASVIAERRQFFSGHGICVSRTLVPSSYAQLEDLVEGRADVAITATDNLFVWNESGADLALIGQIESTTDLVLLLRPGVQSLDDLEVVRLAVDASTNGFAVVAYAMMERLGRARSAYEVIEIGGVKERFEALRQGTADVTLVAAPLDELGQLSGMTAVARVGDLVPSYPGLGIVARRATVEQTPDLLAGYLQALEGAVGWLRATSPRDVEEELSAAEFGPAAVRSVLASLPATVAPTSEGLDVLVRLRESVGMALDKVTDLHQLIDPRAARAAGLPLPTL